MWDVEKAVDDLKETAIKPLGIDPKGEEEIQTSAQKRELRKLIQSKIFWTLWVQLAFLFTLLLFQGFKWHGFNLNDWAFGILANGTLVETFFIVRFIVVHLFPNHPGRD